MNQPLRALDVIEILRGLQPELHEKYGVSKIGVMGSVARNQAHAHSDLDIVVELEILDLFALVHVKEELEAVFGCPVDIIHRRELMNQFLKDRIAQEAIFV